jgi:heme exporter protein D
MKTLATIIGTIAPATAYAAEHAAEQSNGLFVWIFAGMCALVVVAQIVPAIMLLTGMIKGLVARKEEKAAKQN